jgi:ribosomal protein S18 acetylase RimI-like enzyme
MLTGALEARARELGYHILNLDVRETQTVAIAMYESHGYICWGQHPEYALVRGKSVAGLFYYKRLRPPKLTSGQ